MSLTHISVINHTFQRQQTCARMSYVTHMNGSSHAHARVSHGPAIFEQISKHPEIVLISVAKPTK